MATRRSSSRLNKLLTSKKKNLLSRLKRKNLHLFRSTDIHIPQIKVTKSGFSVSIC